MTCEIVNLLIDVYDCRYVKLWILLI